MHERAYAHKEGGGGRGKGARGRVCMEEIKHSPAPAAMKIIVAVTTQDNVLQQHEDARLEDAQAAQDVGSRRDGSLAGTLSSHARGSTSV